MTNTARWVVSAVGALVLPFAVLGSYLEFSRRGGFGSESADSWGLALSILIGLLFLWLAPLTKRLRIWLFVAYAFLMLIALALFGLGYVCGRFQTCM